MTSTSSRPRKIRRPASRSTTARLIAISKRRERRRSDARAQSWLTRIALTAVVLSRARLRQEQPDLRTYTMRRHVRRTHRCVADGIRRPLSYGPPAGAAVRRRCCSAGCRSTPSRPGSEPAGEFLEQSPTPCTWSGPWPTSARASGSCRRRRSRAASDRQSPRPELRPRHLRYRFRIRLWKSFPTVSAGI